MLVYADGIAFKAMMCEFEVAKFMYKCSNSCYFLSYTFNIFFSNSISNLCAIDSFCTYLDIVDIDYNSLSIVEELKFGMIY